MGEKGNFRENTINLGKKHLVFTVIFVKYKPCKLQLKANKLGDS